MISPLKRSDMRKSLAHLVEECPEREQIFRRFGLRGSAGDTHTLLELCTASGIDVVEVAHEVYEQEHALAKRHDLEERTNWCTAPLSALTDNIESSHHLYIKVSGPTFLRLGQKVLAEPGSSNSDLAEVLSLFGTFVDLMIDVVAQEAAVFFPMVMESEKSPGLHRGQLSRLITVLTDEQEELASLFSSIRSLTGAFTAPPSASNAWRALYVGLNETQDNLELYIYKERSFLFPRCMD